MCEGGVRKIVKEKRKRTKQSTEKNKEIKK